ncbi:MAG: OmpA family protein [Chitinophagales bacterium]|nr:OmpA family protein [Bacteroidota bacterium]MCB9044362.1 OmpA family protein [Chitinophagales bacterium]
MKFKHTLGFGLIGVAAMYLVGCKAHGDFTGREYMPDMAHSQAYETYGKAPQDRTPSNQKINLTNTPFVVFADGKSAREPVKGTIPRGFMPYPFDNSEESYERAATSMINPHAMADAATLEEGKRLYTIYCAVCHGDSGAGDGSISANGPKEGPFGGIINYFSGAYLQLEEGKMYHTLQYGKNNMGSYAAQLSADERWKVVAYVKKMQADQVVKDQKLSAEDAMKFVRGRVGDVFPEVTSHQTSADLMMEEGAAMHEVVQGAGTNAEAHTTTEAATSETHEGAVVASTSGGFIDDYVGKKINKGTIITLRNVYFNAASAKLKDESKAELDKLVNLLKTNKDLQIEVAGHTDDAGPKAINKKLSLNRAKSVMEYLVENGIGGDRVTAMGYGDENPVTTENTPEAKARNRRVEIRVK